MPVQETAGFWGAGTRAPRARPPAPLPEFRFPLDPEETESLAVRGAWPGVQRAWPGRGRRVAVPQGLQMFLSLQRG